jgi:hypothetical protein
MLEPPEVQITLHLTRASGEKPLRVRNRKLF